MYFQIPFHYRLLQDIEYSLLCYIGPLLFTSFIYSSVCMLFKELAFKNPHKVTKAEVLVIF